MGLVLRGLIIAILEAVSCRYIIAVLTLDAHLSDLECSLPAWTYSLHELLLLCNLGNSPHQVSVTELRFASLILLALVTWRSSCIVLSTNYFGLVRT